MKDHRLSCYQKIGDIAMQIESLENKIEREDFRPSVTFPGIILDTREDIKRMIYFHWDRINFLNILVNLDRKKVIEEFDNIKEKLCEDCSNDKGPCEEDFFNYSLYKLLEVVL